ncbi:MAG: thiamine-phosphate pyrophosphorylase [Candidatus Omnitrophota bacterium]
MFKRGILRAIDANFNRSKEGLRVIEDIFRFVWPHDIYRKKIRVFRHSLDSIAAEKIMKVAIRQRNASGDLGRKTDVLELQRKNGTDILYVNIQRVKESLRVLEECFKLVLPKRVSLVKKLRYEMYTLEKKIIIKTFC